MEEEEKNQGEEVFLQDEEDAIQISSTQLQSLLNKIIMEMFRKYKIRPKLIPSNFRRKETSKTFND